jgi:hypothetical protein
MWKNPWKTPFQIRKIYISNAPFPHFSTCDTLCAPGVPLFPHVYTKEATFSISFDGSGGAPPLSGGEVHHQKWWNKRGWFMKLVKWSIIFSIYDGLYDIILFFMKLFYQHWFNKQINLLFYWDLFHGIMGMWCFMGLKCSKTPTGNPRWRTRKSLATEGYMWENHRKSPVNEVFPLPHNWTVTVCNCKKHGQVSVTGIILDYDVFTFLAGFHGFLILFCSWSVAVNLQKVLGQS